MSSIGDSAFEERTFSEVLSDVLAEFQENIPRANLTSGQWLYQVIKAVAMREWQIEQIIARSQANTSISECDEEGLKRWSIETGLMRKGEEYATVELTINGLPNDIAIPIGSTFSTSNDVSFNTSEYGLLPNVIEMTKSEAGDQTDAIATPYSEVESISWVNTFPDGVSGDSYTEGVDFTYEDDVITWVTGHGPAADATYYIGVSGSVSVTVSATCSVAGATGNVAAETITNNTDGLSITSVINATESSGGLDEELLSEWRARIMAAKRRTFTYERIRDIISEVTGVRSVTVEQDTGVDQTALTDWSLVNEDTLVSSLGGFILGEPIIQTFVPGDDIVSMRGVTVHGIRVGTAAPPLVCDLIYWLNSGYSYESGASVLATKTFYADDTDADSPDTAQDFEINVKYGGLDKTRTYGLIFTQSGYDGSNYWDFYTGSGYDRSGESIDDWRTSLFLHSGAVSTKQTDTDLLFKTMFGGASYTATIALDTGYNWDDKESEIEVLLDYVDGEGYSPVSIQANLQEATDVYINLQAVIYIDDSYAFSEVTSSIDTSIEEYINNLASGDNVITSYIFGIIMNTPGVSKCSTFKLNRNGGTWVTSPDESDISINSGEIAVLDTGAYGPGTSFSFGGFL